MLKKVHYKTHWCSYSLCLSYFLPSILFALISQEREPCEPPHVRTRDKKPPRQKETQLKPKYVSSFST